MRIIQLLTTLSFGDAVSNDALAIRRMLEKNGYRTELYAERVDGRLPKGTAKLIRDLRTPGKDDILIYHLSTGTELNDRIPEYPCRRFVIFHNITPPEFLAPYSHRASELCASGWRSVRKLKDAFEGGVCDSDYNRQILREAGYSCPLETVPVLIPFGDYLQEPDENTVRVSSDGRTNVLFVGRIAPNKRQENVIRAFDCYRKTWDPTARLTLVGSDTGMENYRGRLKSYIAANEIENVRFPGHIRFNQILAYYRTANVFLCMSEHEGFCVPLLEAMSFRVPIVALKACAVPETLGDAGLLLEDASPETAALAIRRIMTDGTLRDGLIRAGEKRLEAFREDRVEEQLMNVIRGWIG